MSLHEAQKFYYDLCSHPNLIKALRKDKKKIFSQYFKHETDQKALSAYSVERYQTYRNHVSFGILGSIAPAFPVLSSFCTQREWNELLNNFYLARHTQSPLTRRVFSEFSEYLQNYQGPLLKKIPYLHELAEYENLDRQLFFAKDIEQHHEWATQAPEDPLTLIPILNPHLELRIYTWPVHQLKKGASRRQKLKQGKYPIMLYRHPETLRVRFVESNALVADLIEKTRPGRLSIGQLLKKLATEHQISKDKRELFYQEGIQSLADLRQKGILLGMATAKRR